MGALAYTTTSPEQAEELNLLIRSCAQNNRAAQEKLFKLFFPKMMMMAKRYYSDEMQAEEIVNNGFLRAFQRIHTYEFKGSFEGWLRKIVYHAVADYSIANNKYKDNIVLLEKDVLVQKSHVNNLFYNDLLKLVESLPEMTRIVFNSFVIEGMLHKDIAKMLKISEGTSKWHMSEARKLLKDKIEKLNLHLKK